MYADRETASVLTPSPTMDFDDCLSAAGGFGTYQKIIIYLVLLPAVLPCAFHAYGQIFMSAVPEHWCRSSFIQPENMTERKECSGDAECREGWLFDKSRYEATVVTEWDLVCDKDYYTTIALVLFGVGGLVGNLAFGYVQDVLGRRPAFFIYMLIEITFGTASAFADSFALWTFLRIGVGFTVPAILGTPYVLSVELVKPEKRAFCTVLINIIYSIALVALSGVVYMVREWRRLTLITTVPFALFFLYWWVLPESPRWLAANGKFAEAEKILRKMAKVNGGTWSPAQTEILQRCHRDDVRERNAGYGISDLFLYSKLRMNSLIITFVWFANTAVYVGLSYYTPSLGGDEFFNFFLSGVVELPTYLFLLRAIEKGGRRWTLFLSMIVGGVACLGTLVLEKVQPAVIVLYCIGKMGISCSFVVLPLLASEIYPTVIRGIGISFSSVIGQIGPIVIPVINYLGKDWFVLPLLIMGAISVVGGALSLLLPETLHLHLPDTLEDGKKVTRSEVQET